MTTIASQITSLTIVYSTVYSDADQRKHQSSVSLAFVLGIHRGPVNSPHKWPVTRKMFPFDDVIMCNVYKRIKPRAISPSDLLRYRCMHDSENIWVYDMTLSFFHTYSSFKFRYEQNGQIVQATVTNRWLSAKLCRFALSHRNENSGTNMSVWRFKIIWRLFLNNNIIANNNIIKKEKNTMIVSGNGLAPIRRLAIAGTNDIVLERVSVS